jgi:MarR-like DNA-binding transcriptional regulator SgrR of sgrS sRNA
MSPRPKKIHLYSGHHALNGLTRYFADILARDRCTVEETDDLRLADLSIAFVPYQEHSPESVIDTLLSLMQSDVIVDTRPSEYLQQIETELAGLKTSPSSADSTRHLETVSRIMTDDLGLFPLFRPTLYLHTNKRLRNVTLTPDGQVDCRAAIVARLPAPRREGRR